MNKKGGGIVHNHTPELVEMKLFDGGLRNVRKHEWRNAHKNINAIRDLHDALYYERVGLIHPRVSSPTQEVLTINNSTSITAMEVSSSTTFRGTGSELSTRSS
jgi:hypothetical protein